MWHFLALQMSNPAGYQAATTALGPDQQAQLMEVMAAAQRAEEQAAAEGSAWERLNF